MKRCIILVILACVLFVSTGVAEDSEKFVFRNGITWGMSPEEVQECEEALLFPTEDSKDHYVSPGVYVSKYKAVLTLQFKNEQLFMIVYSFQDDSKQTYEVIDYLYEALSLKYGDSVNTTFEEVDDVNRFLFGESPLLIPKSRPQGRIYKFTNVDETDIYLYCNHKLSGAYIMYFNKDLFQELHGIYNTDGL